MKHYELNILFINNEKDFQENKTKVIDLLKDQKAEIYVEEDTGVKEIAYPINKNTTGHYYLIQFKAGESAIRFLNKEINLLEGVLRFIIIALDKKAVKYFEDIKKKPLTFAPTTGGWQPPSRRPNYQPRYNDNQSENSSTTNTNNTTEGTTTTTSSAALTEPKSEAAPTENNE